MFDLILVEHVVFTNFFISKLLSWLCFFHDPSNIYSDLPCNFSFFKTRLTICEGHDGTETSNGDVLIFPDMIRYRFRLYYTFLVHLLLLMAYLLNGIEFIYGAGD